MVIRRNAPDTWQGKKTLPGPKGIRFVWNPDLATYIPHARVAGEDVDGLQYTFFSAIAYNGSSTQYNIFEDPSNYYSSNEQNMRAIHHHKDTRMIQGLRPSDYDGHIPLNVFMQIANDYLGLGEWPKERWTDLYENVHYKYEVGRSVGKRGAMNLEKWVDKTRTYHKPRGSSPPSFKKPEEKKAPSNPHTRKRATKRPRK